MIIKFILVAIFVLWVFYVIVMSNPLNAWMSTKDKEFTKKVFKNQFTMNEFEFAHWEAQYRKENDLN